MEGRPPQRAPRAQRARRRPHPRTEGATEGTGVSGALFLGHERASADAPSRAFISRMELVAAKRRAVVGEEVGNPYHGGAGRRVAKAPTWACRSVGRSLPWHGRGPEFKSRHVHFGLDSKQRLLPQTRKAAFDQVCRLGTSTKTISRCWTCVTTEKLPFTSVAGSARPPLYRMKVPFGIL